MNNIFLVCGYGVPKNILQDKNYNIYLNIAFNQIYNFTQVKKISNPIIIFSGGQTDCFKPYRRQEAVLMNLFFKKWSQQMQLRALTKNWQVLLENKSLSTLENLLFSRNLLKSKKIKQGVICIIHEQTHGRRLKILATKIFSSSFKKFYWPIDFDISSNRYLDEDFLRKKEAKTLHYDLWSLQSKGNLTKHHKLYQKKLVFLRQAKSDKHIDSVKKWWEKQLEA
jgi:hypothetical protein